MPILPGYYDPDKKYDYVYLAFGAGVQSSALLLMCNKKELREKYNVPLPSIAWFADTQGEPYWVYDQFSELQKLSTEVPVKMCTAGNLGEQYISGAVHKKNRFATLPVYTRGDGYDSKRGRTMRQCTVEFKIIPQERAMKNFMGFKKGERVAGKKNVLCMMGISYDEAQRIKPNKTPWIDNYFPLCEERVTRDQCADLLKEYGWGEMRKSSCTFCPFRSDRAWLWLQENEPEIFAEAIAFDHAIRDQSKTGLKDKAYLHSSCRPLEEVDFTHGGQMEFDFIGCDEGYCGL